MKTPEQRYVTNSHELRKQDSDHLIRLVKKMKMDIAISYGMMSERKKANPMKATALPRIDPSNNFRRKVVARCLTILRERGIKEMGE